MAVEDLLLHAKVRLELVGQPRTRLCGPAAASDGFGG